MSVCKALVENLKNKNPEDWDGFTALHMAVGHGSYDILKLLIDNATIKNPADKTGWTPLHLAAREGVPKFKLIFKNAEDKNPAALDRNTPLHMAAQWGKLEVCKFILENVHDRSMNLVWGCMPTPLWMAEMNGKNSVGKFFQDKVRKVLLSGPNANESSTIQASKQRRLN